MSVTTTTGAATMVTKLTRLVTDSGEVVDRAGEAIEGQGIFDMDGVGYYAGFDAAGDCFAEWSDSDNVVLDWDGNRTPHRVGAEGR